MHGQMRNQPGDLKPFGRRNLMKMSQPRVRGIFRKGDIGMEQAKSGPRRRARVTGGRQCAAHHAPHRSPHTPCKDDACRLSQGAQAVIVDLVGEDRRGRCLTENHIPSLPSHDSIELMCVAHFSQKGVIGGVHAIQARARSSWMIEAKACGQIRDGAPV